MAYLLDTNVLLRLVELHSPLHALAHDAVNALLAQEETLYITPRNFMEFWRVATRPPSQNGMGMPHAQVEAEVRRLAQAFQFAPDTPDIYPEWLRLATVHRVTGVQVHDARLAAVMAVHGISHILTFNAGDFRRYPHVTVVEPQDVEPPEADA